MGDLVLSPAEQAAADTFHRLFYDAWLRTWGNTRWRGVPLYKFPTDLVVLQEIICEVRPDLIVETGTYKGGSALFLADICTLIGHGRVVTVDIVWRPDLQRDPRVTYEISSSVDPAWLARLRELAVAAERVLVILDSDHSCEHVLAELRAYGQLVTPGSYLIVEDTNINGHPVWPDFGPGPAEAVDTFLAETGEFERDRAREKFFLTTSPGGYLRKRT
jgi:cephalosporin hydroxylase